MGRGLSQQQRQILGLAVAVADFHSLPMERGFRVDNGSWYEQRYRRNVVCLDVGWALAVHVVGGIPTSKTVPYSRETRDGYLLVSYDQHNPGYFDKKGDGVEVAKASIGRALTRLVERKLIERAQSREVHGPWGYVLTTDGRRIGEAFKLALNDPNELVNRFQLAKFLFCLQPDESRPWTETLNADERQEYDQLSVSVAASLPPHQPLRLIG